VLNLASPLGDGLTPEQLSALLHGTLWCGNTTHNPVQTLFSIASQVSGANI